MSIAIDRSRIIRDLFHHFLIVSRGAIPFHLLLFLIGRVIPLGSAINLFLFRDLWTSAIPMQNRPLNRLASGFFARRKFVFFLSAFRSAGAHEPSLRSRATAIPSCLASATVDCSFRTWRIFWHDRHNTHRVSIGVLWGTA